MYKLFLSLAYLRKRALAYVAMVGVMLCVFMMLVAVSVLNGFVRKIEQAAKGLFGDVVVSSSSLSGLAYYDEFIQQMLREVPEVQAASPFILTYGILQVPNTDYRRTVQIAGIRLPDRADVSDFEEGLFVQRGVPRPTWDPPMGPLLERLREEYDRTVGILLRETGAGAKPASDEEPGVLANRLSNALSYQRMAIEQVQQAATNQRELQRVDRQIRRADEAGDDAEVRRLRPLRAALEHAVILPPDRRAILGLGIPGLTSRTELGETIRTIGPGQQIVLSLIPLGRQLSYADITPSTQSFTVIDDCSTDVSSIDSEIVYLPFETLQKLNNMSAGVPADDPNRVSAPARCSQIHVRVRPPLAEGQRLREVAGRIDRLWAAFERAHPEAATSTVRAETWRQMQSRLVSSIEAQRTLMVIILSVISTVAILLIFVIFYVVVVQKTRDIGVLKAVGASSSGVAGVFLIYGAAVGLVGSVLGTIGGCFFVRNINPIHDWVGRTFGFVVWSRETFMFAKIPNEVGSFAATTIVLGAIASGIVGALVPAIRAARQQPVEALRYE